MPTVNSSQPTITSTSSELMKSIKDVKVAFNKFKQQHPTFHEFNKINRRIDNLTLSMIKICPMMIEHIDDCKYSWYVEAVGIDGECLQFIDYEKQTPELRRLALENTEDAIRYIEWDKIDVIEAKSLILSVVSTSYSIDEDLFEYLHPFFNSDLSFIKECISCAKEPGLFFKNLSSITLNKLFKEYPDLINEHITSIIYAEKCGCIPDLKSIKIDARYLALKIYESYNVDRFDEISDTLFDSPDMFELIYPRVFDLIEHDYHHIDIYMVKKLLKLGIDKRGLEAIQYIKNDTFQYSHFTIEDTNKIRNEIDEYILNKYKGSYDMLKTVDFKPFSLINKIKYVLGKIIKQCK